MEGGSEGGRDLGGWSLGDYGGERLFVFEDKESGT